MTIQTGSIDAFARQTSSDQHHRHVMKSRVHRWSRTTYRHRKTIARVVGFWVFSSILLQIVLAYFVGTDPGLLPPEISQAHNLLIVTAHPDDECLFFSPSITRILDKRSSVKGALLVLSTGNNYGIGDTRINEVKGSCETLGISAERCEVLDHPSLQDNPRVWWDADVIQSVVQDHVRNWNIDAILTFDEWGVSGHLNHRAVSRAIRAWARKDAAAPPVYQLVTTHVLRKYTFLLDLPLTTASFTWELAAALWHKILPTHAVTHGDRALIANTWGRYFQTRAAFARHVSQYTWDRHLYMILSRYVWFNDLTRAEHADGSSA